MKNKIVYLEGDHLWRETVQPHLETFGSVTACNTEHDFRQTVDRLAKSKGDWPNLFVLEQRVRWTDPAPDIPKAPVDVRSESYRCAVQDVMNIRD